MYSFPELIKQIRDEAGLTQAELAGVLGVSSILIAMVESGQKEVSKKFIVKLAKKLQVSPSSLAPFLYNYTDADCANLSAIEQQLLKLGTKFQNHLIKNRAKLLKDDK